jgi:hypothetical protein
MLSLIDPTTGAPNSAQGNSGRIVESPNPDGSAITPDNGTIYDPPISVTIWDAAAAQISVVPYGTAGDQTVTYPTVPGMKVPVLVSRVLSSGTTAAVIRGQLAYRSSAATVFGRLMIESGLGSLLTEGAGSGALQLESGA